MCNEEISLFIISPRDLTSLWHRNTYSKNGKAEGNCRDWRHVDGLFDLEITVLETKFAPSFYLSTKELGRKISLIWRSEKWLGALKVYLILR